MKVRYFYMLDRLKEWEFFMKSIDSIKKKILSINEKEKFSILFLSPSLFFIQDYDTNPCENSHVEMERSRLSEKMHRPRSPR